MQVSRLEIFGFKSFMERLILSLKGGVTGVVGPNGCGKSNIVDALRWVLGETNARSLRGGLLEDVIFNGTDKLRPLGLAEVSLTISSESDSLYNDIVASSKEGELEAQLEEADAQIQEVASKLKKLQEDAEKPAPSAELESELEEVVTTEDEETVVVHQHVAADPEKEEGENSVPLRSSPPKLRVIEGGESFEESHEEEIDDEQEQAHNPLVSEQVLNQKFGWLKGVSEVQVTRRLYRSGEAEFFLNRTPCRLRDLKEFFRVVGISARTFTIVAQGEVSRIVTSKPEQRRQIFEEAAGVLGLRDKIATSERRLKDTADNIARLEDIEREVERQVNSLKRQASRAKRRESLKEELYTSERDFLFEKLRRVLQRKLNVASRVESLEEQEQNLSEQPQGASATEESLRSELLQTELLVEELREQLDALKEQANARGRKEESLKGAQHELRMLFEAKGTEGQRVTERLHTLLERQSASQARIAELEQKESSMQTELEQIESSANDRLQVLDSELRELRALVRTKEDEHREFTGNLRQLEGKLEATRKQMRAQSRHDLLDHEGSGELKQILERVEGELPKVLAELFDVEPRYTKALQTALGERASYFVVSNAADIAEAFEKYAATDTTDKPSFWYGLLQLGAINKEVSHAFAEGRDSLVPALRLVRPQPQVQDLLNSLLAGVYVVPTLTDGLQLLRDAVIPAGALIVTEAGERVTAEEVALPQLERGLLDIQQDISALSSDKARIEAQVSDLNEELQKKQELLQVREKEHSEALRAKQQQEQTVREMSRELGSIRGFLEAERRTVSQTEADITRSQEYELELQNRVKELEEKQSAVEEELKVLLQEDSSGLYAELRELGENLQSKDSERRSLRERFEEARKLAENERRMLDEVRQQLSTARLEVERANMEEEHLHESVKERLPEEYRERFNIDETQIAELEALSDEDFGGLEGRVSQIRGQLLREGEVDASSIERFEEESQRLEELKAQKEDLEHASAALRKTVKLLREQSVTRFIATFEEVKGHFTKLMPRLFGGGSADLTLINADDPLESGVAIIVRPPGKKPKSLDLLSGGEKALCATALIVSLFLVRPSPLCVLDEVDAPLDEANLVRFLSLVKEMSVHTQFLLITHNKASMTAADRLVGVTMQKPGASSVLQVSLEEAYQHVA